MLDSLKAIVEPRSHGDHWKVEKQGSDEKIIVVQGENHRLENLIDFVRSVQFVGATLSSLEGKALAQEDKQRIFLPLAEASFKLQRGIAELSFVQRIWVSVIQFLFTGTSISEATKSVQDVVYSSPILHCPVAAKLSYPQLLADAEFAETSLDSYQEVAKKYALPSVANDTGNGKGSLKNPLLYHLRQIIVEEWHQVNSLMKQGKGLEDPVVKNHIDTAMQTAHVLAKLTLTHERALGSHPYKKLDQQDQGIYAFWVMYTISNFYGWLRSCSQSGALDATWQNTYDAICRLGQDNGIEFDNKILHMDQLNFKVNEAYLADQLMVKSL